jgi:hypothetical protein
MAHNGNSYDFPLLKSEMEKTGTKLDQEILCVDSYLGIKDILAKKQEVKADNKHILKMEIDASTELIEAGAYDEDLVEGEWDMGIENFNASFSKEENNATPRRKQSKVPSLNLEKNFPEKSKPRRKLLFSIPEKPTSFSLINLHKHFLGFTPDKSHGAEADCLTLLRTTAALGSDWMKDNCYLIADCKKM